MNTENASFASTKTLIVNNQSDSPITFICYQTPLGAVPYDWNPLAWLTLLVPPGQQLPVMWNADYSFQWAPTEKLRTGVVFKHEQDVPASINRKDNRIDFDLDDSGKYALKNRQSVGDTSQLLVRQGPGVVFDRAAIGIAQSGAAIYAIQAQPNVTTAFRVVPSRYYVSASLKVVQPGQVLDVRELGAVAELVFPPSCFVATATLLPSLTWSIKYGSTPEPSGHSLRIDRKYTGYRDELEAGHVGVKANIDYTEPTNVGNQTNTWIGLDNVSKDIWVQIGWAVETQPSARKAMYVEVNRHDDSYNIYYYTPLVGGVSYSINKNDAKAEWSIAGTVYHREDWDAILGEEVMPNAQYTVEVFDSDTDYVPGSPSAKNYYRSIMLRQSGGEFVAAGLSHDQTTDTNGGVEVYPSTPGTMAVWDKRNASIADARGRRKSPALPMTAPTSSLTWTNGSPPVGALSDADLHARGRARLDPLAATDPANLKWVKLSDALSLGAPGVAHVAMLSVSRLNVSHTAAAANAPVDIDLFLSPDKGTLLNAATKPLDRWVAPNRAVTDMESELRRAGLTIEFDASLIPKLSIQSVLATVWRDLGVGPHEAGQIVLRPRRVTPEFPVMHSSGTAGETGPNQRKAFWIVEVLGTHVHDVVSPNGKHRGHLTRLIALIDDSNGTLLMAFGLP